MDKREQIAEVLGTELPWLQEDLLKFADKITALFPEPSVGEIREQILEKIRDQQELADDKELLPEIQSNANSYIRGMKSALRIFENQVLLKFGEE